jgi:hypothetical protein
MMWPLGRSRRREIEDRLDRLVMRELVGETIFSTVTALVLRSVDDHLRKKIMSELRKSVSSTAFSSSNPRLAEVAALQLEEDTARLLDQIEHMARFSPGSSGGAG